VSPASPVVELMPTGVASPCAWVAASRSESNAPASMVTRRAPASTVAAFIADRSITIPPSQIALPAMLWPPPRTARGRPVSRPKVTARATSAPVAQRAINAGRRSIIAFQIRRALSYASFPGSRIFPANPAASLLIRSSSFVACRLVM